MGRGNDFDQAGAGISYAAAQTGPKQYKTMHRLQKHYLVQTGDSLDAVIGGGTKPASMIRRITAEIKRLRDGLGELTHQEVMAPSLSKSAQDDLAAAKSALQEKLKALEKRLLELEIL